MPHPLDPARIDAAEIALGYRLPAAYRRSMIRANGGAVLALEEQWRLHPIFDDSDRSRLKRSCNDIIHETREARAWPGFPDAGLAIAANGSGDALVLLLDEGSGAYADTVHCFFHETRSLQPVAESFDLLYWSAG